jgi:hypothetical protein
MMMHKIVVIEWVDSVEYDDAAWKSQEDADSLSPCKIKSAGILVKEENAYITIASSIDESDPDDVTYGGLLSIPTYVIIKRSDFPKSFTSE